MTTSARIPLTAPPGEAGVAIRGLNHWFGAGENKKHCLIDNTLTLMPGELVVMTGPSGSGKTTLLTLVGALRTVQDGSLRVLGRELKGLGKVELTHMRHNIGFIFQAHNLFDSLTALENVSMSVELWDHTPAERVRRATEILTRVGLGARVHYKPQNLSGGQKQRVAIARALVNRPRLVLADEPTAALDKASGREVVNMLKELAQQEASTILLVTHDSRILDVADRIVNMIDGAIASEIVVEEAVTICEFLAKVPAFAATTPAALTEISQKMAKERYRAGSVVIRQGGQVLRRGGGRGRRVRAARGRNHPSSAARGGRLLRGGRPPHRTAAAGHHHRQDRRRTLQPQEGGLPASHEPQRHPGEPVAVGLLREAIGRS
jgi:putative ABC transport system ATP-binding protein